MPKKKVEREDVGEKEVQHGSLCNEAPSVQLTPANAAEAAVQSIDLVGDPVTANKDDAGGESTDSVEDGAGNCE